MQNHCVIPSPVGRLYIEADDQGICRLDRTEEPLLAPQSALLRQCCRELEEYFVGTRQVFSVPVHAEGTPFRKRCWQALLTIPYGCTISYGEQARRIGQPGAARAVGGANHHNPVCIIVPCHRVVGSDGQLIGYGSGLDMKQWLLLHEQRCSRA